MKTRSTVRVVGFLFLVGVLVGALPSLAQDPNAAFMSVEVLATERPDPTRVRAVDSPLWRHYGLDKAGLPSRLTEVLTEANIEQLAAGEDPGTIQTMSGMSINEVMALGSAFDELVYTPLTPCRLINTLNAVGAFAGGETRHYNLIGPANYAGIGGNAAGCGIPGDFGGGIVSLNTVRALNLNFISVVPGGAGDFRAWPTNQAVPLASVLNYANVGGGLNIANGLSVTTCDALCIDVIAPFTCGDPCPAGDLSIVADVSGTHLIVDVYGFYTAATTSALLSNTSEGLNDVDIALTGACQNVTSCTISNTSTVTKDVVVIGSVNLNVNHTLGTHDEIAVNIATTNNTCVGFPIPAGAGWYDVNNNVPTGNTWQGHVTVNKRFTLAANTSQEYFLNVDQISGTGDEVDSGAIQCIMTP